MRQKQKHLLYIIGWPLSQGGHINSSYELFREIIEENKDYKITLFAPDGLKSERFKELGVILKPIRNIHSNLFFGLLVGFKIVLYKLTNRIQIVHALDYRALIAGVFSNLIFSKPLIFTKAGGKPLGMTLPHTNAMIVFSEELRRAYSDNSQLYFEPRNIHLIKERIRVNDNFPVYSEYYSPKDISLFIAIRLVNAKKVMLDNLFREIEKLDHLHHSVVIKIAGSGNLKTYYENLAKKIEYKNNRISFHFFGQISDQATIEKLHTQSMITVGHGRGVLEAMALGKPVCLLGSDNDVSIVVNKTNIDFVAGNNFSGRENHKLISQEKMGDFIRKIDRMEVNLVEYGKFNKDYIIREYHSKIGMDKTLTIYQNITPYSAQMYCSNILWLFKRIF